MRSIILIALLATSVSTPALAAKPAVAEEIFVTYEDLDLDTSKGQETLQQRIDVAARRVCGLGEAITGTRIVPAEVQACYVQARESARTQVAALVATGRVATLTR